MDFSDSLDSFCSRVLRDSAAVHSPLMTDPLHANISETQFQMVRDQRTAMAAKIYAKFRVADDHHEELIKIDRKNAVTKFIMFDGNCLEQDRQLSYHDFFRASEDIQQIANIVRRAVQEDLIIAHADNVGKLSKEFHLKEGRELEKLFCARGTQHCAEEDSEVPCMLDAEEGNRKFLMFDFGALECDDICLAPDQSSTIVDEWSGSENDEPVKEAESVLRKQCQIIREFLQAEGSMQAEITYDYEVVKAVDSVQKFVCVPSLENCADCYNTDSASLHDKFLGFCTSLITTIAEENGAWFAQPMMVVVDYGIQNYHSLVEVFAPSDALNDDFDDFSLFTPEAFVYEPFEEITIRSLTRL
jgi:hypothetical protein